MRNVGFRTAASLVLLLAASGASAPGARARQAPRERVLGAVVYDGDMAGFLGHLAKEFGVTVGFEAEPRLPRPRVKVSLRDATLSDVFDAVVRDQPAYRWRQDGVFVDVYPTDGASPLLDTVVGRFQVSAAGWAEARDALLSLPEVQSGMSAMRLSRREPERRAHAGGRAPERGAEPFTLYLENVPVRRALHEIAKRSGSHLWVYRQYADGEKFFTLGDSSR